MALVDAVAVVVVARRGERDGQSEEREKGKEGEQDAEGGEGGRESEERKNGGAEQDGGGWRKESGGGSRGRERTNEQSSPQRAIQRWATGTREHDGPSERGPRDKSSKRR
ncbi:unnamed protein product, partial [Prorocentrum cordatum]